MRAQSSANEALEWLLHCTPRMQRMSAALALLAPLVLIAAPTHSNAQVATRDALTSEAAGTSRLTPPPMDLERRQRGLRRLQRAGWSIAAGGLAAGLTVGFYVARTDCPEASLLCFDGPRGGLGWGAISAAPPVGLGLLLSTFARVRARRLRAANVALVFAGDRLVIRGRFELAAIDERRTIRRESNDLARRL